MILFVPEESKDRPRLGEPENNT